MDKATLHGLIVADIPEALGNTFPELTVPETPTTVETAIIATGQGTVEIVKWLNVAFAGLTVGDLSLYSGAKNPLSEMLLHTCLRTPPEQGEPESYIDVIGIEGEEDETRAYVSLWNTTDDNVPEPVFPVLAGLFPLAAGLISELADIEAWCIETMKSSPLAQVVGTVLYKALISWGVRYLFGVDLSIPQIDTPGAGETVDYSESLANIRKAILQLAASEKFLRLNESELSLNVYTRTLED